MCSFQTKALEYFINVVMVVLVATLGALVGACVNYVISMFIGRPVVYGFANSRIGHMCLIDAEKVEKAEKYFADHGSISTFLGRLIPGIRQLISIPESAAPSGQFLLPGRENLLRGDVSSSGSECYFPHGFAAGVLCKVSVHPRPMHCKAPNGQHRP